MKRDRAKQTANAPVAATRMRPRRDFAVAALLALAAGLVFCQAIGFQFLNYDDDRMVTANADVQRGLSADGVVWALTGFNYGIWMPVTNLTHLADVTLWGGNPAGHHAVNVLLHAAVAALWYLALVAMTGRPWESALAVLLFALHPMRAPVVAWVSSRKELTCALFCALAVLLYARHAARPSAGRMAAVTAAGVLAMLGKPMAVTLPAALLLLDAWPLGRFRAADGSAVKTARVLAVEKLPLFLFSAVVAVVAWMGQRDVGAVSLNQRLYGDTPRLQNAVVGYARYLAHTVWPVNLTIHDPVLGPRLTTGLFLAAAAVLAVITVAVVLLRRRGYPAVAWCWYLGTLTPVIGIVGFANTSMADRYAYLPHMGLFIAAGWGLFAFSRAAGLSRPGRMELAGAAALVVVTGAACVWQTSYWRDSERVLTRAVAIMPDNALARVNLAAVRLEQKRPEEALAELREAVRCAPDDPLARMNLGSLLAKLGRTGEAITLLAARVDDFAYDHPYQMKYATILFGGRGPAEALPYFKRAVDLLPNDAVSSQSYAVCLIQLNRFDEARAELKRLPETAATRDKTRAAMELLEQAEAERRRTAPGS